MDIYNTLLHTTVYLPSILGKLLLGSQKTFTLPFKLFDGALMSPVSYCRDTENKQFPFEVN